jgi:pSer/pThr/pTyr-binding forkhead associated (FHA) protein
LVVPGRDAVVPLGEGLLIGRAAGCDLRLDDGKVSRQHARVERRGQGVWIADLGSSNGVFVNGRRVGQPLRLAPGDRILIGDTSLEVVERGS